MAFVAAWVYLYKLGDEVKEEEAHHRMNKIAPILVLPVESEEEVRSIYSTYFTRCCSTESKLHTQLITK